MGLDVYVGSLTRYYAGDWETVVQRYGRETGMKVEVIRRPADPPDAIRDPEQIRPLVLQWRNSLNEGLGDNLESPLGWDEGPDSPYFTDKPAWDCYTSLLLWAAYEEHPEFKRPVEYVGDFSKDPAFVASTARDYNTRYPNLLRDVEVWLPGDFAFTFRGQNLLGKTATFGSSVYLLRQLRELNARTWKADEPLLQQWRRDGSEHQAPLEKGAWFAFSIMHSLAHEAVEHQLPMLLDY
jgi:hypothetical protein